MMTRQNVSWIVGAVSILLLVPPAVSFAQLPTPTYGWNLGNTLEPPCGEGCWGPAATEVLINAVADAGFNTVRIPCAWDSHADQTTYVIDSAYMARVKQVVDWCYARDLYVILNCHWDNGWLEKNITDTVNSTINAKQSAYWTQIANTFISYDDHLLFAGCNEPDVETAGRMSTLLVYEQTFVNAVRATGGSNITRWLVVQGPKTDIDLTYQLMNTLPTDPTPGRLMVEIHYYSPYQYTLMDSDADWGKMFYFWGQGYHHPTRTDRNPTWGEEDYMETQFQKMKTKFIDQGIPVVLGEFCAMKRTGYSDLTGADYDLHLQGRTYFHKTVVDTANSMGLKPVFWDIAGMTFDWTTGAEVDPDNIIALTGDGDTMPPSAPANLTAQLSGIHVNLNWDDNTEEDLRGYNVYRSTTSGGGYTRLNGSAVLVSEYADTPPDGETYYYAVTAVDTSGNESDDSGEASVTIPDTALGTILQERWIGIPGTSVEDLTSSADYPDSPFTADQLTSLEGSIDWMDEYGTRIRGYLYPPVTGEYTFWIAGDDNCQLWLSTDGTTANASLIAEVPDWTNSREWNKYPDDQESSPVTLTEGQKYYIEVLHKEGVGGDNIAVAWAGPGISQQVIGGQYLSPWFTGLYGDFTGEGDVNLSDLVLFCGMWLDSDCIMTAGADIDGDCSVGLLEFSAMGENWLEN